jgi:hypothetical protein
VCEKRENKLYISSAPNKVRFESILFLGEISFDKFAQKKVKVILLHFFKSLILKTKKKKEINNKIKNCLMVGLVTSSEFVVFVLDIPSTVCALLCECAYGCMEGM